MNNDVLNKKSVKSVLSEFASFLRIFRWTSLDSHILYGFISSLFGSMILFISIYQLTQLFQDLRWLPQGTDAVMLIKYYSYSSIYWATILEPFSFLFATVFVLSRMAQQRELVAIISTGTSIYRVSFYIVLFTVLNYFFMVFYFQNTVVYPSYQKKFILGEVIFHSKDMKSIDKLKDNTDFSIFGANNLIYIVGHYDAIVKEIQNVTIIQLNDRAKISNNNQSTLTNINQWLLTNMNELTRQRSLLYENTINLLLRIDADKAVWNNKEGKWLFNIGTIRYVKNYGESFVIKSFTNQSFDFITDPPYYFEKIWYVMSAMTYEEGRRYIETLKRSHQDYKGDEANYLSKFSYPLGLIFVVLAGIGIVDMSRRKISFIVNLMVCLALFIVYYLFYAIGISLAEKGNISTQAGAYSGGIFFGIISIILFLRTKT